MAGIYELVSQIREYIEKPWKQYTLLETPLWFQLTSALDMIEDMEHAINAYEELESPSLPLLYLSTVGVLQALFVQQDAMNHLIEALGYRVDDFFDETDKAQMKNIREIRNQAIGHPTKRDRPKPTQYNYIIQRTLSLEGFEILFFWEDGRQGHRKVDLPNLISLQRSIIQNTLAKVISRLSREDREHREMLREENLISFFQNADYFCGKVAEAVVIGDSIMYALGLGSLDNVAQALENFREALERCSPAYFDEGLKHKYELLEWAINHVRSFLEAKEKGQELPITHSEAEIYTEFICSKVRELQEVARDIDQA